MPRHPYFRIGRLNLVRALSILGAKKRVILDETIRIIHSNKGEPAIKAPKGQCHECPYLYVCRKREDELPPYLRD